MKGFDSGMIVIEISPRLFVDRSLLRHLLGRDEKKNVKDKYNKHEISGLVENNIKLRSCIYVCMCDVCVCVCVISFKRSSLFLTQRSHITGTMQTYL